MQRGMYISEENLEQAVYGGCILGGGGGGWIEDGLVRGRLALSMGRPRLLPLDYCQENEIIATVSGVGAPSSTEKYVEPVHYLKTFELLQQVSQYKISGLMTNENGASGTVNGWLQSVVADIPVLDAAGDGRAHPTAIMGSIGLYNRPDYISYQAVVGGDPQKNRYIELILKGDFNRVAALVRQASIEAGGIVAVARDPLPISYIKENAAVGAITHALKVGEIFLENRSYGAKKCAEIVTNFMGGKYLGEGTVSEISYEMKNGFDIGTIIISNGYHKWEVCFWNEYMCIEEEGERLATFPDLIMTFSDHNCKPVVSAEVQKGMELHLTAVPQKNIILGESMKRPEVYKVIEKATDKKIICYSFGCSDNKQ